MRVMVFNATFNNISVILWWSVLLVEETGVRGEKHWSPASHWQTLSHHVVSSTPLHEQDMNSALVVIGTDCLGSCKSNYHMITLHLWGQWTVTLKLAWIVSCKSLHSSMKSTKIIAPSISYELAKSWLCCWSQWTDFVNNLCDLHL